MDRTRLQRYSRHILLPEIDISGQQRLLDARVLIVGLGGLGSPIAMYLAASGVGHLILNDDDDVELGNLQRQIVHATPDLGRRKTASARDRLASLNPDIRCTTIDRRLTTDELAGQIHDVDLVIDATDNFGTRFNLSDACLAAGKPLVWGAVIRLQGQATVFDYRRPDSPCLACLYPEQAAADSDQSCVEGGVLAPVAGIVGCVMATEALKLLIGLGDTLFRRLLQLDARGMNWRQSRLARDPYCEHHKV